MKKITLLLTALTTFLCYSQSQKEVTLKIRYNPNTKYIQTIEQTSQSEIKYSGSADFLQKMQDRGIQNPMVTNNDSKIETVFKTGKLTDGTNFPLTIEFTNATSGEGKKIIPDGTLIYGRGSNGNMPILDSIVSNGIDENVKKRLLQTMQSTFSQLSFPEKKIKIGENYSVETPLSIPLAGTALDMIVTTTYKLISITDNIADFDVSSVYTLKSTNTKYNMTGTGNGKGKLLYDIANNNNKKYETDTEMKMHMKLDNFDMDVTSKSGFIQTTVISNN